MKQNKLRNSIISTQNKRIQFMNEAGRHTDTYKIFVPSRLYSINHNRLIFEKATLTIICKPSSIQHKGGTDVRPLLEVCV